MARCAGVQKVSRPIVRCQEISQIAPTTTLVEAKITAKMDHGMRVATARSAKVSVAAGAIGGHCE